MNNKVKQILKIFVPILIAVAIVIGASFSIEHTQMCVLIAAGIVSLYYINSLIAEKVTFSIRDIVEIAMFVALAMVFDLSFMKIRLGNNGGSISLVMFPLFCLCLRRGFFKGTIACGLIYGLINCIMDGYGFASFPLDYLLAFGSLGIIGLFRNQILNKSGRLTFKGVLFLLLGSILAIVFRTGFATLSGMIFYGLDFGASLIYQLTYLLPSSAAVIALLLVMYKPLLLIEKHFPTR